MTIPTSCRNPKWNWNNYTKKEACHGSFWWQEMKKKVDMLYVDEIVSPTTVLTSENYQSIDSTNVTLESHVLWFSVNGIHNLQLLIFQSNKIFVTTWWNLFNTIKYKNVYNAGFFHHIIALRSVKILYCNA